MEVQQEEVGTAPPMPDTEVEVGDQPEEEEANSSDPNHDLGTTAKERAINSLVRTSPTTSFEIDDRVLTFCVLCGDPRHTMTECQYDQDAMPAVTLGIEIMRAALLRYPRHQRVRGTSTLSVAPQPSEDGAPLMDVDETGSTVRRPAKARPRRGGDTFSNELILIRYDNCGNEVTNRRGAYLLCGVSISDMGPESDDEKVVELIEEMSDHRDGCFPQPGDRPRFAMDAETGQSVHPGYRSIGDGVRGGILDLIPVRGTRFAHPNWEIVEHCIPRNMSKHAGNRATWALSCVQSDLRHRIATTSLDAIRRVGAHR